jgi:AraC-like DNA-binding protein
MEWLNKMNDAIDYIEMNITAKVDYAQAANIACCSLSRFQNMFMFITDITPSEYVRRRISLSANELINDNIKIIDLSLKYGYESPAAFTRSFKTFHGFSPSVARKFRKYIDYPRISFQMKIIGGHFTMETNNQMAEYKDILVKVEIIELPKTIKVACLKGHGFAFGEFEEVYKPQLFDRHTPYSSVGFFTDYFGGETYVVGCIVDTLDNLPEGLDPMDIGVKRFASVTFRAVSAEKLVGGEDGPGDGMITAGEYIDKVWRPQHKDEVIGSSKPGCYEITSNDRTYQLGTFEVYKTDLSVEPEMCFYIPLK